MYEEVGRQALSALEQRGLLAQQLFSNREYEQTEGSVTLFKIKENVSITRRSHNKENC